MKFKAALIVSTLAVWFVAASGQTFNRKPATPASRTSEKKRPVKVLKESSKESKDLEEAEESAEQPVERTIVTDANVAVRVCVASGSITVRGWDKKEVRARSSEVAEIEFQHEGEPAKKIELLIADRAQGPGRTTSCLSFSDVEMDVPRGATVQLQTRDGDINIADVATAYVNTQNGDVSIERASKAVDAGTIGGVISLKDSSGWFNLHSAGGNIDASGVRASEASDIFEATSVGGDITLEQVAHARLNARSLNGSLNMTGKLAHGGHYGFKTISGDVTLTLPVSSSFKISAKLSTSAELITDFPITLMSYTSAPVTLLPKMSVSPHPAAAPAPKAVPGAGGTPAPSPKAPAPIAPAPKAPPVDSTPPAFDGDEPQDGPPKGVDKNKGPKVPRIVVAGYPVRRIDGICGNGDAFIDVGSFSGTVHLRKQ